jgi:hypothetical protein
MRTSAPRHARAGQHSDRTTAATGAGSNAMQRMADRSSVVQRLAALQAAADDSAQPVVQLQKIGPGGAGYKSTWCGEDFVQDHLARNRRQAEQKTLARAGARGMLNTVMLHKPQAINKKVENADYESRWEGERENQYIVPIPATFLELEALVGANERRIKSVSEQKTGTVNVKAYFNEGKKKTFKVTGVDSVG